MNVLTLSTSFMLGALDGVSPGHGKSLIAAFMIGEKLSVRQIMAMGFSLLLSHFLLLLVLSVGLQYFFGGRSDLHWLEWISPVVVIAFGLYLLLRYRTMARKSKARRQQGDQLSNFTALSPENSSSPALHLHDEDCDCGADHMMLFGASSSKSKDKLQADTSGKLRHASLSGFLLGLVPCPMAVSTVFLSMSSDQFSSAILVISVYVLGMALVLALIAALVYVGRSYLAERLERLQHRFDVRLISAWMVIGIGIAYLLMNTFHIHSHMS